MKNPLVVLALLFLLTIPSFSQEEGAAVARLRFDKPNTLMVGGGLSLTFGKNVGDYSRGMNWEAGFQHRLNKVMSVGAFISKVRFNYDPSKSLEYLFSTEDQDLQISPSSPDTYRDLYVVPSGYNFLSGYQLSFGGGDLTQTSVGVNLRFDLIPYSEKIPFSVFIHARPFVTLASRTAVFGSAYRYLFEAYVNENVLELNTNDGKWYPDFYFEEWGVNGVDELKAKTNVTAGLQVGPGIEFRPSSSVSIFAQALLGYTLPVTFISTTSYVGSISSWRSKSFPMVKEGFPSLGIQAGIGYNF